MKKMKRFLCLLLTLSLLFAAGCSGAPAASSPSPAPQSGSEAPSSQGEAPAPAPSGETQNFSIGTASVGGLMYVIGAGWANVMGNALPQYHLTAEVTAGNPADIALMEDGEVEFCTNGVMSVAEGYAGEAEWTAGQKYTKLRAMFPMNPMMFTAITLKGNGIETLADLDGKIVGLGSKGGAVDGVMLQVFEKRGIHPKQIHNDGWSASVTALSDGLIDAFVTMQMAPSPSIVELEASKDLTFITFSEEDLAAVNEVVPSMADAVIPAGSYKGVDADIATKSDWAIMCAAEDIPEDVVYNLVKATFENVEDLKLVHQACANIDLKNVSKVKIPYHPGALKYYEEMKIDVGEPTVLPEGYQK